MKPENQISYPRLENFFTLALPSCQLTLNTADNNDETLSFCLDQTLKKEKSEEIVEFLIKPAGISVMTAVLFTLMIIIFFAIVKRRECCRSCSCCNSNINVENGIIKLADMK